MQRRREKARVVERAAVVLGMAQPARSGAPLGRRGSPRRGSRMTARLSHRFPGRGAGRWRGKTQRLQKARGSAGFARKWRSLHCCGNVYSKKTVGTSALRRALLARFLFRFRKYLSLLSGLRAVLPRICRTAHESELTAALRRRRAHRRSFVHPVVDGAEDMSGIF